MKSYSRSPVSPAAWIPAEQTHLEGAAMKGTPVEKPIVYDKEKKVIRGISETSKAVYTIPETFTESSCDVYLGISRFPFPFIGTSTPVTVSVNQGPACSPSMRTQCFEPSGNAPGKAYDDELGLFCILENTLLRPGDTITVKAVPGLEFYYMDYQPVAPVIGDLFVWPTGTEVLQGYEDSTYVKKAGQKNLADPLSGLEIGWLGSSVTYGQAAGGYSMADAIEDAHPATRCHKYAVSGTTLAEYHSEHCLPVDGDGNHGSYVNRMKRIDKEKKFDLFIVQLSTNDATGGIPMGAIAEGKEYADFDTATVIGAMEYIIRYVRETWHCPLLFYTGTRYDSAQYEEMVKTTLQLREKWGFGLIDLWNDAEMNAVSKEDYASFMADPIHPLRKGYTDWWTPVFEKKILRFLNSGHKGSV